MVVGGLALRPPFLGVELDRYPKFQAKLSIHPKKVPSMLPNLDWFPLFINLFRLKKITQTLHILQWGYIMSSPPEYCVCTVLFYVPEGLFPVL